MNRQEKRHKFWLASQEQSACKPRQNNQLKAIEKHCFNQTLTSNYKGFEMKNSTAMKSWTISKEIANLKEELNLLIALASDDEKTKCQLAMAIITKCQRLAAKVEKVNSGLEDWEKQGLSREIREIYNPLKKYDLISSGKASVAEKRQANNVFKKRMDKVFDKVKANN